MQLYAKHYFESAHEPIMLRSCDVHVLYLNSRVVDEGDIRKVQHNGVDSAACKVQNPTQM